MSIKDFIKYKCEECGKNFTHNIGLKGHITAVHERKHTIVITVCKNFTKVFNLEVQTLHQSHKTLDWNYKLQLFMKIRNCDQCGKNFARGCNLYDHEIDSWIKLWKSPFLDLKFKKGHIQIVHEGVLIFPK